MLRRALSIGATLVAACTPGSETEPAADVTTTEQIWQVRNAGVEVNSRFNEAFPTIASNGLVLYFASDRASYSSPSDTALSWRDTEDWDIYVSTRPSLDAPWGEPARLGSHINTTGSDHSVTLAPDGHWLYFSSDRPDGCGNLDIYVSYREDTEDPLGWENPKNLGCEVNSSQVDACAIYHVAEDLGATSLYFVSNRAGGLGSLDVYRSRLDPESGSFGTPDLVKAVSSPSFDGHLDPDAGFIWSRREGGMGGSDLWVSEQSLEGDWSSPVNLGASLNTEHEEQMPSPLDHGRILYFPFDRPGGLGGLDLYIASRRLSD